MGEMGLKKAKVGSTKAASTHAASTFDADIENR